MIIHARGLNRVYIYCISKMALLLTARICLRFQIEFTLFSTVMIWLFSSVDMFGNRTHGYQFYEGYTAYVEASTKCYIRLKNLKVSLYPHSLAN